MRIFGEGDERRIHEIENARTWKRSGLISQEQLAAIESKGEPLAYAGIAIRLLFFGFAALAQISVVVYAGWKLRQETSMGLFLVLSSVVCWFLGEWLIRSYRLYRYGIEEALITGAGVQFCAGLAILFLQFVPTLKTHGLLVWSLPATIVCIAVYARYGYLYAGFGAIFSIACIVFGFNGSDHSSRLALACVYGVLLMASTFRQNVPDYNQHRWSIIQACLFLGTYLILNLHLSDLNSWRYVWSIAPTQQTGIFYWFTYAAIWILPLIWLYWGVHSRHRAAMDSACVALLITLITNKPYLGMVRHAWDPAILGALMMGIAVWLSRWLNSGVEGKRNGFTAKPLLQEKENGFAVAQLLAASAAHSAATPGVPPSPGGFKGGGGSSGGAGAGGGY